MLDSALVERLLLSYTSGVLAAVSPCVIVLVPLVVFRFVGSASNKKHHKSPTNGSESTNGDAAHATAPAPSSQWWLLTQFIVGFQLSYLLFGFVLSRVLTSGIQNGFRLGLGGIFIVICLLAVTHHLDPLRLPLFENTFFMGCSFALLVSFNPCTVPFLGVVISLSTADAMLCLTCFGNGLLTPSIIAVFVGRRFTQFVRKSGRSMATLNTVMSYVLGLSGLYLLVGDLGVSSLLGLIGSYAAYYASLLYAAIVASAATPKLVLPTGGGGGGSARILDSGDVLVMALLWALASLLVVHRMEVMDLTQRITFTAPANRSKLAALAFTIAAGCLLFAGACGAHPLLRGTVPHDMRSHRDWATALSTSVSVADTANAPGDDDMSAPCVDTSALRCAACTRCLYAYCGVIAALATYILFVHFVLWPKWYPSESTPEAVPIRVEVSTPVAAPTKKSPRPVIPTPPLLSEEAAALELAKAAAHSPRIYAHDD